MNEYVGSVIKVFIKPGAGVPMAEPADGRIALVEGYGIEGDVNAHSFSPRQVLVTRQEDSDEFGIRPGELRENITIGGLEPAAFVPGALVRIAESVHIRLTLHCEPCKRIDHLVHPFGKIKGRRGLLGVVVAGGSVQAGDVVLARPHSFLPVPEGSYDRFVMFTSQIPRGSVVTYKQVVIGMGAADSYIRAIPRYIQQALSTTYPVHRIVDSDGDLVTDYIPDQERKLLDEHVQVARDADFFGDKQRRYVDIRKFGWNNGRVQFP